MKKIPYNSKEVRTIDHTLTLEKREDGNESRKIRGYAAVFNSWSRYLGWFKEKIDTKAFDEADMSDVVAVLNHDFNFLLARNSAGTLEIGIDEKGLWYEFEAPNTSAGNDLMENVRLGNISKSSFQFQVENDNWIDDPNEGTLRVINKISRVIDVSPVTFAAYNDTDVAQRSYEEYKKTQEPEPVDLTSLSHAAAEIELLKLK